MIENVKMEIVGLEIGMYVCRLDRPWLETPYPIQGILIRSREDIEELARHCTYVYVDIEQTAPEVRDRCVTTHTRAPHRPEQGKRTAFHGSHVYSNQSSVEEELPTARDALEIAHHLMDEVRTGIERGLKLDVKAVQKSVDAMRESVIRNPDALLLLTRVKALGAGGYDQANMVAAHLLAFGRHLGLPKAELSVLGLGGLLMNVGYLRLPPLLLRKTTPPTPEEHRLLKAHVTHGEAIIAESRGIPDKVAVIAVQHHEREDGSGYPRGLHANQIHPYGRMAAIVNAYAKLVLGRPGSAPASPFEAMTELRGLSKRALNATLVEQFAHCIGLFPVGSLVELSNGEVAIVLTHSRAQRFSPRIMIVLDPRKIPHAEPRVLDLKTSDANADGVSHEIVRDLKYGSYGIDPRTYFL